MISPATPMRTYKSYGIACMRLNSQTDRYEFMMVQKRLTYSFSAFAMGKYKKHDENTIRHLFSGMTSQEKIDLLSLDYSIIWFRLWRELPIVDNKSVMDCVWRVREKAPTLRTRKTNRFLFNQHRRFFENNWLKDGGKKMRKMLMCSTNSELPWELPRGRQKKQESGLSTAIREFSEETGMSPDSFQLLLNIPPITHRYVSGGNTYSNTYYPAICDPGIIESNVFNDPSKFGEVVYSKFLDVNNVALDPSVAKMLRNAIIVVRNIGKRRTPPLECDEETSV